MKVKIKKLHPDAVLPKYATPGAACFDLHAIEGGGIDACGSMNFATGLSFEVPAGHVMLIYSRSGHGFKNGVRLANGTGVIDSDYRGEVVVKLHNDGTRCFDVNPGDRIAQAMIVPIPQVELVEVDELTDTERGTGGLGSTGR
jgi:dUTP pyrophosphatase